MSDMREKIMGTLSSIALPDGGDLASRDMVRALTVDGGSVSFVIEAPTPEQAAGMEAQRRAAETAIAALDGVERVSVILTAHSSAKAATPPPNLKIGGHPKPQAGPLPVPGWQTSLRLRRARAGSGNRHSART